MEDYSHLKGTDFGDLKHTESNGITYTYTNCFLGQIKAGVGLTIMGEEDGRLYKIYCLDTKKNPAEEDEFFDAVEMIENKCLDLNKLDKKYPILRINPKASGEPNCAFE